jgi:hypothetical protein
VFVPSHVHARPAKRNSFHPKAEPLLCSLFAGQLDRAASADDSMPRQSGNLIQYSHYLTRRPCPSDGARNGSVG